VAQECLRAEAETSSLSHSEVEFTSAYTLHIQAERRKKIGIFSMAWHGRGKGERHILISYVFSDIE
jgi:hypothetical protein